MVKPRGFTIVELIMVIIIIGFLAAVVGPRFFIKSNFDERFYYEELLSALRYAQKLAVAGGCPIQVDVLESGTSLSYFGKCGVKSPGGAVLGDHAIANQRAIKVVPDSFSVVFNSLGCVSGTAICPAQGVDELQIGESSFTVKIHRATGFIEVTP